MSRWSRWLPGITVVGDYQRAWLGHDVLAGLVLTSVLVPAGMAYAEASGLPPVNGLYATILALGVYFVLGPSKILVVSPDSSLAPLIAATITPLAASGSARATDLGAMLAVLTGGLMVLAAIAWFGFLTELLSKPVRYGFLNGIASTIIVSQLPKLCGFSMGADNVVGASRASCPVSETERRSRAAVAIGLGSLAVILLTRRYAKHWPGLLLAVVASIVVMVVVDPAGVAVVGSLPDGFPTFHVPDIGAASWGRLLGGAVSIAIVAFADTSILSRTLRAQSRPVRRLEPRARRGRRRQHRGRAVPGLPDQQ